MSLKHFARIFLVLIFVSIGFCAAFADINELKEDFLRGDYKAAIKEGEKLMASPDQPKDIRELYYLLGLSYMKDGNYLRSSDIFEILINEYPGEPFRKEAMLGLGDVYMLSGNPQKAREWYTSLLSYDQNGKFKTIVQERLGKISINEGDTAAAQRFLKDVPPSVVKSEFDIQGIDGYAVQVGCFSRQANAKRLTERLLAKEYRAYILTDTSGTDTLYRVRVGPYQERSQAELTKRKLVENGYPAKIIP